MPANSSLPLPLDSAPDSLCLLRLSAIGDVTHVLPIVRTLQQYWPETKITWIIGRLEHQLVGDIDGIEFIVFDKSLGWGAYRNLYQVLRKRRFDIFLHMQVSMRSNLASLCVKAPIKLGFDKQRAKDYQWLFSNKRIDAIERQHVLDGFFQFLSAIGLNKKVLRWDIPLAQKDADWATSIVPLSLNLKSPVPFIVGSAAEIIGKCLKMGSLEKQSDANENE